MNANARCGVIINNCKSKYFYNLRLQSSWQEVVLISKMSVLSGTVFAFFLRRFVLISFVIMITANVHISTTSSKFSHVVSSLENKSCAIFQTKTIGHPPREAEKYSAGREITIANRKTTGSILWSTEMRRIHQKTTSCQLKLATHFISNGNKGNCVFVGKQKSQMTLIAPFRY